MGCQRVGHAQEVNTSHVQLRVNLSVPVPVPVNLHLNLYMCKWHDMMISERPSAPAVPANKSKQWAPKAPNSGLIPPGFQVVVVQVIIQHPDHGLEA